ncbi:MAG: hypothetical protein ACI3XQ_05080 [Eubacteriales bacterium]
MKVLIISAEVWQDGTNGGNVLSNMFSDTNFELAQIYCNPGIPDNHLCKKYYQMTDSMVIHNFLKHKPIGKAFELEEDKQKQESKPEKPNKKFYHFFRSHRLRVFYTVQSIIWNLSNWKNKGLNDFVKDFSPDIIFAPCYGNTFMLRLTRYIAKLTGKKVISYISDDSYTLKQFSLSPFYWINRFAVRRQLRKTFPYYSLVYTMTETQKQQCERDFGANMKILLKSVSYGDIPAKETVGNPIRLVYAGGIYLNRWKTLLEVANAIKKINANGVNFRLDIYTANELPKKAYGLNDGVNSFVHAPVSQEELKNIYHNSDIALHTESFDLKNRLAVRMSFSTKIVDCLSSGCAVMAVCDEKQGGFVYLKENDAALCVSSKSEIYRTLEAIVNDPKIIFDYAENAKKCCLLNHDKKKITNMIITDFERIVNESPSDTCSQR